MKNATVYEKKIKKLLTGVSRKAAPPPPGESEAVKFLLEAILQADATRKSAQSVVSAFDREFVDYNELRVAPAKDIVDAMGRDFPGAREKADSIVRVLNAIFDRNSELSMKHMEKMPKRDLRKHLQEIGLSPYAAALVTMTVFGGHAVPIDLSLLLALEANGLIYPESDLADVQGFLERIISQKDNFSTHEFFRDFVDKNAKSIAKRLKEYSAQIAQTAQVVEAAAPQPQMPMVADTEGLDEPADEGADEADVVEPVAKGPAARPARPKIAPKGGAKPARPAKGRKK